METRNEMTTRWLKETAEMGERHNAERETLSKRWDKELAELEEKPKLRHGDYGLNHNNQPGLVIKTDYGTLQVASNDYVFSGESVEENAYKPTTILGNIFDDLARKQKGE